MQGSSGKTTASSASLGSRSASNGPLPPLTNKPRVRREWRTLSPEIRQRVADAFWVMANTTTQEGRKKYGINFWNAQDLTGFHVCAVIDPRCARLPIGIPSFPAREGIAPHETNHCNFWDAGATRATFPPAS